MLYQSVYKGESFDFEVTTLTADVKEFNVTFDRNGTTYSVFMFDGLFYHTLCMPAK